MPAALGELRGLIAHLVVGHIRGVVSDTDDAAMALMEKMQTLEGVLVETLEVASRNGADEAGGQATASLDEIARFRDHIEQRFTQIRGQQDAVVGLSRDVQRLLDASFKVRNMAEQTHMLSINAQIEAMHAGEAGVGFEVVAREVRTLAGSSREVAGEIEHGVGAMGDRIRSSFDTSTDQLKAEQALMLGVVEHMSEALAFQGLVQERQSATIAELRTANQQLRVMIVEAMALAQFQDIVRQKLETVEKLVAVLGAKEIGLPELVDAFQSYNMAAQRQVHNETIGGGAEQQDVGMEIELF